MSMVCTLYSRIRRAIEFVNNTMIWIGIGKSTAWGDPDEPPVYDPINHPENNIWWEQVTALTEPIGFKKVETKKLVIPDAGGAIEVIDEAGNVTKWSEVQQVQAYTQGAKYVYLTALLDNTLPYTTFRQLIVFSSLVLAGGVPSERTYALPAEVQNAGCPELVQNTLPYPRSANTRQRINIIYEF